MSLDILLGSFSLQVEGAFFGIVGLICLAVWVILGILIAIWVYRDAESRGMSGALWLIICWLTFPIGLIIYFVVRTDKPQYGYYPQQQPYQQYPQYPQQPPPAQPPPGDAPPPAAAPPPAQPQPDVRFCSNCGASLPPGAGHCPNCGTKI